MKLTIVKKSEDMVVIPQAFKDEKNPPKFIFKCPDSSEILKFLWGGSAIDEAVYSCFLRFENKIELVDEKNNPIEYSTYEEFVKSGASTEIALIHNECRNAVAQKLNEIIKEAKEAEKKCASGMPSILQEK